MPWSVREPRITRRTWPRADQANRDILLAGFARWPVLEASGFCMFPSQEGTLAIVDTIFQRAPKLLDILEATAIQYLEVQYIRRIWYQGIPTHQTETKKARQGYYHSRKSSDKTESENKMSEIATTRSPIVFHTRRETHGQWLLCQQRSGRLDMSLGIVTDSMMARLNFSFSFGMKICFSYTSLSLLRVMIPTSILVRSK